VSAFSCNFRDAILKRANLRWANLRESWLLNADFEGADLRHDDYSPRMAARERVIEIFDPISGCWLAAHTGLHL
jgi:uncharacterized protein YjbI with pentapeptide repeats